MCINYGSTIHPASVGGNYTHGGFRPEDVGVRNQLLLLLISFLLNSHQGPELNWVLANFLLFNVCTDSVLCRVLPRTELEIKV